MEPREESEQTLVLIKPDALKNSLTGYVFSQLSEFHTGLRFAGCTGDGDGAGGQTGNLEFFFIDIPPGYFHGGQCQ